RRRGHGAEGVRRARRGRAGEAVPRAPHRQAAERRRSRRRRPPLAGGGRLPAGAHPPRPARERRLRRSLGEKAVALLDRRPRVGVAMKVHHVAVIVADLGRAEAFYSATLGLPVLRRWADAQGAPRSVWLELDGAFLALE